MAEQPKRRRLPNWMVVGAFALDQPGCGFDEGRWDGPGVRARDPDTGVVTFLQGQPDEWPAMVQEPTRQTRYLNTINSPESVFNDYLADLARTGQPLVYQEAVKHVQDKAGCTRGAARAVVKLAPEERKRRSGRKSLPHQSPH